MEREKIKLLVIGCPKSGKSSLIHRYNTDEFDAGRVYSHGDLVVKTVTFNGNDISLHIWELEDKQCDNQSFYDSTDGLILVSDVNSIESVVGLNELYNTAKKHLGIVDNTFPVAVVANKIDLKGANTEVTDVTSNGLRRWATSIWPNVPSNLFYVETSAKDNVKVKDVFDHMAHYIYHSTKNQTSSPSKSVGSNLMNSFYGNPLHNRRGSAVKTTEFTYSPSNDLSHLQQQRQLQQQQQQQQQHLQQTLPVVSAAPGSMTEEEQIYDDNTTLNIVVAGSCYSGKTAIVSKFMGDTNIFTPVDSGHSKKAHYQYEPTIGVDFRTYTDMVIDDMNLKLQIWDSSGNPAMRSVARAIYRDADGIILVYDISSEESFLALDGYLQDFLAVREVPDDFVALLVGNKCDLSDKRAVPMERVLEWCSQKRDIKPLSYIECSALTGTGIKDVFVLASDEVCDYLFEDDDEYTDTDYDDGNGLESESDEETTTNYTVSVNDEDFTPVSLSRMNSHNRAFSNADPGTNNFHNVSHSSSHAVAADAASEIVSEISQARGKRPRSKNNRSSGRLLSGDLAAMLNSELEAANKINPAAAENSTSLPETPGVSSSVGDINVESTKVASSLSESTKEVHNNKLPAEEADDADVNEAENAQAVESATGKSSNNVEKKKKLKKSKSELNDENILNQLARSRNNSAVTTEKTCWTDLWVSFSCIINPEPPAPMAIAEAAEDSKTVVK